MKYAENIQNRVKPVGLSNILDSELSGRQPAEGSHGQVVRATVVDSKLLCKVIQGLERAARVEAFLIFAVAALDLAVVPRRIGANQFMPDAKLGGSFFKQSRHITFTIREPIGKLKAVVCLDTFHLYASALIPFCQFTEEVCGGTGRLLRIGGEKPQPCELVNGCVLEQTKLWIRDALAWHDFHIHLDALTGTCHLLVRLRFVCIFRLFSREQSHFAHDSEQAFRTARIAPQIQTVPQLDHAQFGISAAHVTNKFQLGLRVLVWMAVRASGLAGQGRHTSIPALLPKVDIRPAFVVLSAGAADTVFLRIFH